MRIVDQDEFLSMPAGTVYSEYMPQVFTGLFVKESGSEKYSNDYIETSLIGNIKCEDSSEFAEKLFDAVEVGSEVDLDFESGGRNGMFNSEQLYAVYSKEDVKGLIDKLGG